MASKMTVLHGSSLAQAAPVSFQNPRVTIPGRSSNARFSLTLTDDILSKHLLLLGGTGCGKTNVFYYLVHQLKSQMKKDDVMIVFDTKGDFYKKFYQPQDVVLANSSYYAKEASKWNIYKEIVVDGWDDGSLSNNTNEITRSFFKEAIENSQSPFFPNAARDLLASIILATIRLGKDSVDFRRRNFNNEALKSYLNRSTPGRISCLLSSPLNKDLSAVLTYIGDGQSDQGLGVLAEMQNVMRQLLVGSFAEKGGFSVRDFVRKKSGNTLFIEYDLSIGESLTPIYRLLFDLALKEAMGRTKSEGKVYFICDEFKLLPHLQHIEDGVNFGRSLGVNIIAGLQSIEQLYELYDEYKGRNIAAGFSSVFAFKSNDSASRDYISDLYGKNIVSEQFKTAGGELVEEKRDGKTVEDWDLMSLNLGEAIIGFPFEKPFKFLFDLYRGV